MKNRIVYTGLFHLPDRDAAANRVRGISKILLDCEYKITFVGLSDENIQSQDNIDYVVAPTPQNAKDWIHLQFNCNEVLNVINNDDTILAVILYNYPSFLFSKIRKLCKKKGIKIIADCTEWYHSSSKERFALIKNLETSKRMYLDNKRVDGLIVISKYLQSYYKEKNTILIPPIFDYSELRKSGNGKTADIDKRVFVFAGSITSQKEGIKEIVESFSELSKNRDDVLLKIIGVSKEDYIKNNGNNDNLNNIHFFGRMPHDVCISEIKNSDFQIFVRQSNRVNNAGFSTKFSESYACGIPVITTKTSNLDDYLIDGYNGYWITNNINEVIQKAISITDEQLEEMKKRVSACDAFSYSKYTLLLQKWLTEVTKH